ncbi:SMP-30/gluconolactonase/LRE family protein [Nitrospirillum viridazoti]|uniref:Gluconolaconase n=1 Tax=Nitrospirillum viridazoti CBAmc TaxID=1441467 RepID=A0A248K1B8_9PROT|nr:SMP-30/gluconolactonase/LRE family protein [Nitrospirillum amazonense]ASG24722.1 gluconolaconase [Nitrospirillum amazonense CBAmc]TWB44967.1 sugar lactone lactonase YvrE [Nitrospirillum amazonense]
MTNARPPNAHPVLDAPLVATFALGNTLGEGVTWDERDQSLWWTDIHERRLHRLDWASRAVETFAAPERVCSFGLIEGDSGRLVVAFESGFALFTPRSGVVEWLARQDLPAGVRFNDGRVDRQGRFWAGTMVEDEAARAAKSLAGALYRLDGRDRATPLVHGALISNSLCWSPDGTRMYYTDGPTRRIRAFDYDPATGMPSNERVFVTTEEGAFPDGANIDAAGHLWSAQWGASQVVRYAPDGSVSGVIPVPTARVSCVAFGGPDLTLLFVTTAREGMTAAEIAADPDAGTLFVYDIGIIGTRGLVDSAFKLASAGI